MEALLQILSDLHPDIDFEKHEALIDEKILDSFDIITLITEINEEYDVRIPVDEIIPKNFNSAKSLYELIKRLQDED
ncbi:MAG: acyl carrier protein [Clostridiaceae bacterium]|jgi:D-alanine--poly(phosphoribitol) ligase subunit 2|nr:acyl carrier protein [Clostridiaceae bacterium]